ncbi:uncharacterized protein LOC106770264 [Vigna radiata var. radiata]|uniref:Uncharacterized protein LOC106770264 n=1 Tax=Vigna radiata var. radiata TaxID=3916 RepID=A0A1S3UZQ6_VIGRR|nr:uncharacterized protein LOC106770264 [Vigna radiata var. radiata]
MAEHNTRSKTIDDAILRLTQNQAQLTAQQTELNTKIDSILSHLSQLDFSATLPPPSPVNHTLPSFKPHMKLDVPRFDGCDATGWIFKINQFFEYHSTPEEDRLKVASFYMEGTALSWFQWMHQNGLIQSWPAFLQALETRFAPSFYEDPRGLLFKLSQRGTVNDYLTEFERLASRVVGLPPSFLLSCFISGLSPEIKREVLALQPLTFTQAAALAKLQEDKFLDLRKGSRNRPFLSTPHLPGTSSTAPSSNQPLPPLLTPPPKTNFKKLTHEEMLSRREKGLCYNCDEKFHPGHKCKARFFLLVAETPDDDISSFSDPLSHTDLDSSQLESNCTELSSAQISFNALSGLPAPEALRLMGLISKQQVTILVDGGSTHNFIQDRVAKFLNLPSQPTPTLKVMVGNGSVLECHHVCPAILVTIQGQHFTVDFHVLPISGAEVILGIQWLKLLGPIITDYSKMTISFMQEGRRVELTADIPSGPQDISAHQLKRIVQTHSGAAYFHIQIFPHSPFADTPTVASPSHPDPLISSLLNHYKALFLPPTSLPPPRNTDHHIHLMQNSSPVNVRPYRYPHFQKCEIERQIDEMLQTGLIQPSHSPFSSPVLLVKKKDGSWRFCVDFRALNLIFVKDRFPLPTIDELLDELGGAKWFSKLDLRQGFHQIRMHEADIHKTAFRTHMGHYEYKVMPFGLCNAPSTFQATMNDLLKPFLRKFVIVFFDDILVYSKTFEAHLHHLECTFKALIEGHFFLKESKCVFAQQQLEYLGHIVSAIGVAADPSKIQAMVEWPTPCSIKSLRGFLGLTGFYRRFIKGYALIASPLIALLKKEHFVWCPVAQSAFEHLKKAMTEAPVLALPDFTLPFQLETDASGSAMGAVLMQQDHPIAFFSKPFCPKLLRSSTYVRELHAITSAVKKWRQYLLGHRFIILTDHRSLKELMSQVIQTPEQQVYLSKLLGYDYAIQYKAGNTMWLQMPFPVLMNPHPCPTCQQTKYETQKPAGLLQPLPTPHDSWEDLSLDFITGLPPSVGHTVILVVVDRFSKGAHFGTLPNHFTAFRVAQLFMDMVCKHHGIPRSLVSDCDPILSASSGTSCFVYVGPSYG